MQCRKIWSTNSSFLHSKHTAEKNMHKAFFPGAFHNCLWTTRWKLALVVTSAFQMNLKGSKGGPNWWMTNWRKNDLQEKLPEGWTGHDLLSTHHWSAKRHNPLKRHDVSIGRWFSHPNIFSKSYPNPSTYHKLYKRRERTIPLRDVLPRT